MSLTSRQWQEIRPYLSIPAKRADGRGRPRASDKLCVEAIFYVLETGTKWKELPKYYPAKSSVHRRFQQWSRDGSLLRAFEHLVRRLASRHKLSKREGFIDGSLVPSKKGAPESARVTTAEPAG